MEKSTLVVIIDSIPEQNIGHHWQMAKNFRKAFSESEQRFVYLNPSACAAFEQDCDTLSRTSSNDYVALPQGDGFFRESVQYLRDVMVRNPEKKIRVIFLWLQQLHIDDLREFLEIAEGSRIEISGISNIQSNSETGQRYFFEVEFNSSAACRKLWVWSQNQESDSKLEMTKLRYLPEYHPSVPRGDNQRDFLKLGFFGFLSQKRGLCEILIIGLFNRRVKVEIKGYGYSWNKIWSPQSAAWLKYRRWQRKPWAAVIVVSVNVFFNILRYLPNVKFDPSPFEKQSDLEKAISECSFIFYAAHAPLSSGIVLTSLAAGVPVIWLGQNGEATRQLSIASAEGQISKWDVVKPRKVERKMLSQSDMNVRELYSWEEFKREVLD